MNQSPETHQARPILLNSWEGSYFKINELRIIMFARAARRAGIELFVMDDGWFGNRNDETSSLGDWFANEKKLPNGLSGICKKINDLGLDFGIWVEPEMISKDSNLYRKHPDYAMTIPGRDHSDGRNQMVLDLTRADVQDYIIESMSRILGEANISYVKWDYNRNMSDIFSSSLPPEKQGEVMHRYYLGFYRIMETLTTRFSKVLFEGCAAGGNRFDLGILCYFPQIWASDNSDAICRAQIQEGYSYGYPQSTYTCHVTDSPNHQTLRTTPLYTRFNVASFGILGYEFNFYDMNLSQFNEIREQIRIYKENRELFQFGQIYRGMKFGEDFSYLTPSKGNNLSSFIVSQDKKEAVSIIVQSQVIPNTNQQILKLRGLDKDTKYAFKGFKINVGLTDFGGLINYVAPFHIKPDGKVHNILSKFVTIEAETQEHVMYGDALMNCGVHLKPAFSGGGFENGLRFYPDYGSRMYMITAVDEDAQ